jgi:hypothetical protein
MDLTSRIEFLHTQIARGKTQEVENFIFSYVADKHLYNSRHNSAVNTAISNSQHGIYELLLSKDFTLGPHEDLEDILEKSHQTTDEEKRQLREIHKKFFKNSSPPHLIVLLEKSKLNHDISRRYLKLLNS